MLEADPPWRLVTTWSSQGDPELARATPSRVTWEIEERATSCLLRVTHDRLEAAPKTLNVVGQGRPGILDGLRACVEAAA